MKWGRKFQKKYKNQNYLLMKKIQVKTIYRWKKSTDKRIKSNYKMRDKSAI
jgi:hypothetical protein